MKIQVSVGDVLDHPADVLISTANPWLNMSGGVNGAILARDGAAIQDELRRYLSRLGTKSVPAGTVIATTAGALDFRHVIHAVAIDPFYGSSVELVRDTLAAAFALAHELGARSLVTPSLATGYGPLSIEEFAQAFRQAVAGYRDLERIEVVVRSEENAAIVRAAK